MNDHDGDDGYATAEAAVALPALLVVLALAIGVLVSVGDQLRCVDAARVGARVASRGDGDGAAAEAARRAAPAGAQVRITHRGDQVEVTVTDDVRPFGPALRMLPSVAVGARATAQVEAP
jgi:hypothetical protein